MSRSRKKAAAFRAASPGAGAPCRPAPGLNLSPHAAGYWAERGAIPTPEEIRAMYGPAHTLGAPEDVRMVMDSQLDSCGVYSLMQHSFELGMGVTPQFMGYGALQNIAQNGLIRACVETVADDMTRAWIQLTRTGAAKNDGGTENGESDDLLADLTQAQARLELQSVFHEAAAMTGYEGGAFVFIDTGVNGDALVNPLHIGPNSGELRQGGHLRFVVVDPVNVFPGDYNSTDPLSRHYFRPRWWWVMGQRVHASRLIRLVAEEVPVLLKPSYNFLGIPQAQILWDYVMHFQDVRVATQRLLTKFSLTVFKTSMADILTQAGGTSQLDRRIRLMADQRTNDGVLAIDKESEDVVKLETPISGMTDVVRQSLEILAAMNRTPAVKLLGISPSGFNATGESDIRNYYDHIASRQEKVLRDGIKKALDCIQIHLRGDIDPSVGFDFAPLGEEDRAALANLQKTKADTIAVYVDREILSPEEARKSLADDPDSGFSDIAPDELPGGMEEGVGEGIVEGSDMPAVSMEPGRPADIDDVDKAGAVYDAAPWGADAEAWRTTKNGKHFQVETETGEITKGNVGQKSGPAIERQKAIQAKIDSIRIEEGRDSVLPSLNAETLQELGKPDKPVLLKKGVWERNARQHADVPLSEAQSIIGQALYNPVHVARGNSDKDYFNFIGVDKKRNCVVLLDVEDAKDNFEIVHWHYARPKSVNRLRKKAEDYE